MIKPSRSLLVKNNPLELGWELFCWQGYLRFLSKRYDKITVIGKQGHEILYKDFCDIYIPHNLESSNVSGHYCYDMNLDYKSDDEIIVPSHHHVFYDLKGNNLNFNNQKFIKFGNYKKELAFDILFHIRNMPRKIDNIDRNYGTRDNFETIVSELNCKIATIGGNFSDYVEGTVDLRGIPLETLADVCASSGVVVGSLSGPIHFASLCGLKQITWSGIKGNEKRVKKDWNPFNTEVTFFHSNVFPQEIMSLLKNR